MKRKHICTPVLVVQIARKKVGQCSKCKRLAVAK